jgi:hypothetical protein
LLLAKIAGMQATAGFLFRQYAPEKRTNSVLADQITFQSERT